jgi:hypothetical protein
MYALERAMPEDVIPKADVVPETGWLMNEDDAGIAPWYVGDDHVPT